MAPPSHLDKASVTAPVCILTARLDAASFAWLDDLRRAHFPAARNLLSAHLTMFHRLSPLQVERLCAVPRPARPIAVDFDALVFLGAGNAVRATAPELVQLRDEIRAALGCGLSRQDAQRWMPHVTIQNKVTPAAARTLQAALAADFRARSGSIDALEVWDYLGGPWRLAQSLPFGNAPA